MTWFPPGAHLGDALSALLDNELASAALREAEAHLATCRACQAELGDIAGARAAVRALPVRAFPPGRWEELIGHPPSVLPVRPPRRALWAAAAAVAAGVALWLPREPQVAPALPALADSHAVRASVTGDPLTQLAPIAVPVSFGP
jgi:anti-sigma factor RsiW